MLQHFGPRLRILHWCTDQAVTNALADMELTSAQGRILGYLGATSNAPCAKDVEEVFRLTHPTVSGLLGRLERKGFVEIRPDEQDRRCKRIYILPKGRQCNDRMHSIIRSHEERLVQGFTDAEKDQFSALLDRAIANMGCEDAKCKNRHREDSEL